MSNFWDNVTPQSVASAKDGFKEFQIGDNDAFVKSAEEKISESGNPMLVITFVNDEGAEIKHFIVEGEYKQQKLKQFYIAFGIPIGSQNIREWINKRGIVVCKQGKPNYNGNTYNQVSYLKPRPGALPAGTHARNTQHSQPTQQTYDRPPMEPGYMTPQQTQPEQQTTEFTDDIPF